MIDTPWGASETLRERMLPPGPGHTPEDVERNQRQRLFGAMVTSVALRGYESTRVADLAELSGVSTRTFYELFPDKRACFLAAVEALLWGTVGQMYEGEGRARGVEGATWRVETFLKIVAAQPAASRMSLVEAYAAGPDAAALVDRIIGGAEKLIQERIFGLDREMPAEILTAGVAAVLEIVRQRLLRNTAKSLPNLTEELIAFLRAYEPPVRPLRSAARAPDPRDEDLEAGDHAERALRAFEALLVEQPYEATTMEQVAKRATMSVRTLYANFPGREELMLGAVDSACAQVVATMLPAYRRGRNHGEGVRTAFGALFGLLASRPNLAHLLLVGLYEGGGKPLATRMEGLQPLAALLTGADPVRPSAASRISVEALVGAVLGLARRRIMESGPGALVGLTPVCTFLTLTPLLGAEQATAAAEGKSYRRSPGELERSAAALLHPATDSVMLALAGGPLTPREIGEEAALGPDEVAARLETLRGAGVVDVVEDPGGGEPSVRSNWGVERTEEWATRGPLERSGISAVIRTVIAREIEAALESGTFDARPERHLSRLVVWTDEEGWREISEILDEALDSCLEAKRKIAERLARADPDAARFRASIAMTSFELPEQDPPG